MRFGVIDPFLRLPLSRLPSSLPAKRTATSSTQQPEGAPRPNAKVCILCHESGLRPGTFHLIDNLSDVAAQR